MSISDDRLEPSQSRAIPVGIVVAPAAHPVCRNKPHDSTDAPVVDGEPRGTRGRVEKSGVRMMLRLRPPG